VGQQTLLDRPAERSATRRSRWWSFVPSYALMVIVPLGCALLILWGGGRDGPAGSVHGGLPGSRTTVLFLLAITVIMVAAWTAGGVAQRLGQPPVVGEIVAGLLFGPSVLGLVWPDAVRLLAPVQPYVEMLSNLGLVLFMFIVGLELNLSLVRGHGHIVLAVGHASTAVPFVLGIGLGLLSYPRLASPGIGLIPYTLFVGLAVSMTALPVLARILYERRLQRTRIGVLALSAAAVADVTGWCLLAGVVSIATSDSAGGALRTLTLAAAFCAVLFLVCRPAVKWLVGRYEAGRVGDGLMLVALLAGTLLSALTTEWIGIHIIFGAFLFGVVIPRNSTRLLELTGRLETFTVAFLLPLFFVQVGLRTHLEQVGAGAALWATCGIIVAIAVVGKFLGTSPAARMTGLPWRQALGLGALMNCRGLTELIVLNIGLDLGILSPELFTMLVIMALVTTVMTVPVLNLLGITRFPRKSEPDWTGRRTTSDASRS
jgi:Kef-type K+ transport system membrane component KefB